MVVVVEVVEVLAREVDVVVVVEALEVLAREVVGMDYNGLQFLKMTNICRLFFTRFHHIKE